MTFPLGVDVEFNVYSSDIKKWPNILIAGSTGSGKSILLHNIILSMFFTKTPYYADTPYLLRPVITDSKEAVETLSWLAEEAERREGMINNANVENNTEYNKKAGRIELPDILVINDTMDDIMVADATDSELSIVKLAKISEKVGIHQISATSRPYASVFTGLIRANIPTRAAFSTQNQINSRITLGLPGAEKLTKNGDMLFLPSDSNNPIRLQTPCISLAEIKRVVDFVRNQPTQQ